MAKYNVKNLNYIAVGPNRTLINADIELGYQIYDRIHFLSAESKTSGFTTMDEKKNNLIQALSCYDIGTEQGIGYYYPTEYIQKANDTPFSTEEDIEQIILNEEQEFYIETDSKKKKYIRLYLSCCTEQMLSAIENFNRNRVMVNQTFLADHASNNKNDYNVSGYYENKAFGLYDIRDVSIKKLGIKEMKNHVLHDTDYHHDIYAPSMPRMPVGFCQTQMQSDFQNDAIILSRPTSKKPYYFRSSLIETRNTVDSSIEYTMHLESDQLKTYIYGNDKESNRAIADFFNPAVNFSGMTYSYIIDLPLSKKSGIVYASDIADYDDGVAYFKRLMTSKSAFNSIYSMEMSSMNEIDHCRDYIEIKACSGKPYLKYYDNLNYLADRDEESMLDATAFVEVETQKVNSEDGSYISFEKVPYQKIEYIYPIDYRSNARHKSNVYSIVISDTKIEELESDLADNKTVGPAEDVQNALNALKFEIIAAIRDIAQDVAPANTELFDVKFQS